MRIVAGTFRGRRLAAPRGRDVRPTSDRVREALFSILGDLDGLEVLDLFAGTGAMGLEALSRGAATATFVEIDRQAHEVVRRNVDAIVTDGANAVELIKGDAPRIVRSLALAGRRFDLVFFDPPYEQTGDLVAASRETLPTICATDARVVLELSVRHRDVIASAVESWSAEIELERTYGDTIVAILRLDGTSVDDPGADVDSDSVGD
ncbi:MAG: rsmD [Thermoleophilia bacterium]|nr:rsmD [Thermoleophilia bacterium]MCZ4495759.1 rsmD [Thermoleophilia bacterium]